MGFGHRGRWAGHQSLLCGPPVLSSSCQFRLGTRVEASQQSMLRREAHHHPVRHEEDQRGCDVDGEERAWGTPEVRPLTAAEQILLP